MIIRNEFVEEVIIEKNGSWAYEVSENDNNFYESIPHTDGKNYILYSD